MEPNRQLGNYTLEEKLGSGATADVFMAMQLSVERTVAVKVMHSHLADSHDFAARFQREARAMGRLQHPHIARVIDFDATGAHPYMVIEYLPGGSLRDLLDGRTGPLGVAESVVIARQLADALQYANGMGMVHRDVKPANVMFVDEARSHAVLTDFGIARLADDAMTATGTVLGTPAYIAPEQVQGHRAEAAADQYSLGVMLFEMVTGERPFAADSPHALMMKHVAEPVPSARALNPLVPVALDQVIQRSIAKSPADRYTDAGEMIEALDLAVARNVARRTGPGQTVVATQPPALDPEPTEAIAQPEVSHDQRRAPSQIIAATIAGILLIGGAVFGITQLIGDDDPTDPTETTETIAASPDDQEPIGIDAPDDPASPLPVTETTAAEPTLVPQPTAGPPTTQLTVPSFDPDNPPPLFVTNATIVGDRLVVGFDRSRQPSAGTTYIAWMDGVVPVGEITIDENGQARLETAFADAAAVSSFIVTEEPLGSDSPTATGPIVLSAGLDEAARGETAALIVALDAAERELAIAREHDLLMRGEIDAGNLNEVRRHAEHVVNILDGSAGDNFGDLDGSGLAENPGDDIGVRGHLADAASTITDLFPETDLDAARAQAAEQVADVERAFLRVLAVDSIGEIAIDAGTTQLESTTLDLAQARALFYRHFATDLVTDTPIRSASAGVVWLAPSGDELVVRSGPGGFRLPDGVSNDATLIVQMGEATDATQLGELDELHMSTVAVPAAELAELAGLVVTLDSNDSAETQIIARIDAPAEALAAVEAMLGPGGSLAQLEAQAQLVLDHTDLMQKEIDGGTLAELRRHAEHVVNLVEGAEGEHFGDLDGDGVAQNPGDDVGVLAYLDRLRSAVLALPVDSDERVFYTTIWLAAIDTIRTQAVDVADQALRVFATDSPAEAQPFVTQAFESGVLMLDGTDVDRSGVIDLFAGEFGVRRLDQQAPTLVVAPLLLDDSLQ